jgi:hypothetical protein
VRFVLRQLAAKGKQMMQTGTRAGYWVVAWADGFDPSLADLLPNLPELILGRRVAIASCDSGPFKPSEDELVKGWAVQGMQAVSPLIQSVSDLPAPGFDEWYVYEDDVPIEKHAAFVNRFGFSPLDPECQEANEFWEQVRRFQPLHVLGAGTPTMFLVTRDEEAYARAIAVDLVA